MLRARVMSLVALVWVCLAAGVAGQPHGAEQGRRMLNPAAPRNLTVDDLFQIREVQDAQLSPEGKWVAYTVTTLSLKEEKSETQIWMVPTAGGEAIPMTAKGSSATRPRWSPDGKYLAFLAARNGDKKQVWLLNRNGGDSQQLTDVEQGVQSYNWSPDGRQLVLVVQDPTGEEIAAAKAKKEGREFKPKTKPPWVIGRLQFKRDEIGYLDRRRMHLYVFTLATKKMTQITSGDFDDSDPAWSPDGRFIAFVSNRSENGERNYNTDIWVVAADNPDKGKTLFQLTSNPGGDRSPAWSPDGQWIAYASAPDVSAINYATYHLAVIPSRGGTPNLLTQELDRRVYLPRFSADSKSVYFIVEDSAQRHVARVARTGGEVERPIGGPRSVRSYSLGKDRTIVAEIRELHIPGEIFVSKDGQLRQLTTTNDEFLARVRLAEVENIHYKSKDGTPVEGFVFKPPAFNPELRYPTLLRIHGGPVLQYDYGFNFEAQLFAAHGYVVVAVNPRGSAGYGQEFSRAIFADWGNKDYEDLMAGVDYAIAQGYADPDRLGVGGWSFGGILTNYVITKTDRFKAAISGASEVLYVANYGHDHHQRLWEVEMGLPWENRELWDRLSPFNKIENIVTPTLVIGGEIDWNVPIQNSEQLYIGLKRLGRTTQLVVYPGEYHRIRDPSYQKDRYERYLAWYDKYVKGEPSAVTAGTADE